MSKLNSEFDDNTEITIQTKTRVDGSLPKDEAVLMTVKVDLSGVTIESVLNIDFNVRVQAAFRKSFDSHEAFREWADNNDHIYNVHVSRIGHKIVSKEQQRIEMKSRFAGLPDDMKAQLLEDMRNELDNE